MGGTLWRPGAGYNQQRLTVYIGGVGGLMPKAEYRLHHNDSPPSQEQRYDREDTPPAKGCLALEAGRPAVA
jgi:hypothetical protein